MNKEVLSVSLCVLASALAGAAELSVPAPGCAARQVVTPEADGRAVILNLTYETLTFATGIKIAPASSYPAP